MGRPYRAGSRGPAHPVMRARAIRCLWLAALPLLVAASGCETNAEGVQVDLTAAARAYREQVDRKPGREEMERIIAQLPADKLNDLGVLYEREGRLDDAVWAYQQAVWRDPRSARSYVNLGNVLRKQGKLDQARFRFRQAMAADPTSFEAANNFADLCAAEGTCIEEAIVRLEPMVEGAGPYRPYGLDTLGWLYHLRGEHERALGILETARGEAGTADPALTQTIDTHLAEVRAALGQTADTERAKDD